MSKEILATVTPIQGYSTHKPPYYSKYNSKGEMYFDTNSTSAGSEYIPIDPTGKTYYYDIIFSANAGNMFDIGFERYDKDKTPRTNSACTYVYATNSATDIDHKRIRGTVNLSTDTVNPCAFIALRILNGWSGTTSGVTGTATIHYMSLREVVTSEGFEQTQVLETGVVAGDTFIDKNDKMSIEERGLVNGVDFMEI